MILGCGYEKSMRLSGKGTMEINRRLGLIPELDADGQRLVFRYSGQYEGHENSPFCPEYRIFTKDLIL